MRGMKRVREAKGVKRAKGFKGAEKGRRSASSQGWLEGEEAGEGLQRMVGKEGQSDRGKRVPVSKDGEQGQIARIVGRDGSQVSSQGQSA